MNEDIIDLSDTSDTEVARKSNNQKRWKELKKYIAFLEYIVKHDPVKNLNFKKFLDYIKSEKEYSAKIASSVENRIRARYEKLKSKMVFPPHIVAIFAEVVSIVISDEDEEPVPKSADINRNSSDSNDVSNVRTNKCRNNTTESVITHEKSKTIGRKDSINECIDLLQKNELSYTCSNIKNNAKENESSNSKISTENVRNDQNKEETLEDGEIFSDDGSSKNELQMELETCPRKEKLIETEDDIVNEKLFAQIDNLTGDAHEKRENEFESWKDREIQEEVQSSKNSVLRQKNLNEGLSRRRSVTDILPRSLSPISSDEGRIVLKKKKKKKHKHKRRAYDKLSGLENNSDKSIKDRRSHESTVIAGDNPKSVPKQTKKSKKHREKRIHRLHSVSDDEEEVNSNNVLQSQLQKTPEESLFQRRDPKRKENKLHTNSLTRDVDTVILLDSDEEDINSLPTSVLQSGNNHMRTKRFSPENCNIPHTTPTSTFPSSSPIHREPMTSPSISTSNAVEVLNHNSDDHLNDVDMAQKNLDELEYIYSVLSKSTGIELEKLLVQNAIDICPQRNQEQVFNQTEDESNISPNNNFNDNHEGTTEFGFNNYALQQQNLQNHQQQREIQQQEVQQQNQLQRRLEQEQFHQQQQQTLQMQYNSNQTRCTYPGLYPFQNSVRPGLNLNDPRINRALKQIRDSPIHNLNTRDAASMLLQCTISRPQNRNHTIPEVTSKTATTYKEHKRLRELEKQNAIERQNSKNCTIVASTATQINTSSKGENVSSSRPTTTEKSSKLGASTAKRTNSSGSESGRKTPNSNRKETYHVEKCNKATKDKSKQKHSSESESGTNTPKSRRTETDDEEESTHIRFSINPKSRQRIESSSSEERSVSVGKCTKRKDSSGPMTQFEQEKVLDIVCSAIGKTKESISKTFESLSKSRKQSIESTLKTPENLSRSCQISRRQSVNSAKSDGKSSKSKSDSDDSECNNGKNLPKNSRSKKYVEEYEHLRESIEVSPTKEKKKRGRGRPKSFEHQNKTHMQTPKKTKDAQNKHSSRELRNLNCTLLEYQRMFESNCLDTVDGKRRCSVATTAMFDSQIDASDSISQKSEENFVLRKKSNDSVIVHLSRKEVKAAPIQRRRQTCSALSINPFPKKKKASTLKFTLRRLSESGRFVIKNTEDKSTYDTDEFNIEEHTKPQDNQDPFELQLQVKLKKLPFSKVDKSIKLSDDTLQKYNCDLRLNSLISDPAKTKDCNKDAYCNTPVVSNEIPILFPSRSKPVDTPLKAAVKNQKFLNVDIGMTISSTKTCAICNKRPSDLTNHYVAQHKTESYISRLTSYEIETLEANITVAVSHRKRYKVSCVFCQDDLEDHFINFHAHYSSHTGEYGFKCDVCGLVKPYREDIRSHQLRTSKCRNSKIRTNYLYSPDLTVIYLFVCKLCNFVQLNEANIHKHHRDHHGYRFDSPHDVKRVIIAKIDTGKEANEVENPEAISTNPDEVNFKDDTLPSDTNLFVQEQEYVHEPALDIKDVFLAIDNEENEEHEINKQNNKNVTNKGLQLSPDHQTNRLVPEKSNLTKTIKLEADANKSDLFSFEKLPNFSENNNLTNVPQEVTSPELSLAQIHASPLENIMTIIHCGKEVSCRENHQPYSEPVDEKPNVKKIKIEQIEMSQIEPKQIRLHSPREYRQINSDFNYFGLYKCTIDDCWFSTNTSKQFIIHIQQNHTMENIKCLKCAYCSKRSSSGDTFVQHVRSRHSMSLYQCSECCYRSMEPGNIYVHREICHKDNVKENRIYLCSGRCRPLEEKLTAMKRKLIHNVTSLPCPDCSSTFFAVSSIKSHIQKEHPLTFIALDISKFNEFCCAYCNKESNSKKDMQIHMAIVHPDEICYIVERKLIDEDDKDEIENLNLIDINVSVLPTDIHSVVFEENENSSSSKLELEGTSPSKDLIQTISEEEQLVIDRIKTLLDFITSNLETQCPHLFICLHCLEWIYSREKISDHFATLHGTCSSFMEKIIPSANKSYYIVKEKEVLLVDWTAVLKDFLDRIRNNWIEKVQQIAKSEWANGLASSCLEEIDIPELIMVGQPLYKCLVKSCPFVGIDENSLDLHVNEHTMPRNYKCSHCAIDVPVPSWESIKNHKMLHRNELRICSVCKFFHHNASGISEHINNLHNSRDVPVITLWRDKTHYRISVAIVSPPGRTSFATMHACFCCGKEMKGSTKFRRHLRMEHNIILCRKCDLCNEVLLTKSEVDTHSQKHRTQIFKLKYDILVTSLYNLTIQTMSPFTVEVRSSKEKRHSENVEESVTKRPKVDEESPIKIKEEVIVKMECEDDVIVDKCLETQCGLLKCVNMDTLVDKEHANINQIESNAKRLDRGKIYVKSTAELQMPRSTAITPNISQNQQKQGELYGQSLNTPSVSSQNQTANSTYPTSLIQNSSGTQYPRYIPQPKHSQPTEVMLEITLPNNQGTALIASPSQSYPNQKKVPDVLQTLPCPGYPNAQYTQHTAQAINANFLANNQGSVPILNPPQPYPRVTEQVLQAQTCPVYPSAQYSQHNAQVIASNVSTEPTLPAQTCPGITHPVRTHYAEQNVQPLVLPTISHPNINYTGLNYTIHNVQPATTLTTMSPPIPSKQPVIRSGINNPEAAQSTIAQIAAQSSLDETHDSLLKRLVPEITPICENCKMECIDFSHLNSHFEAVHAPKNERFVFRLTRRVKCRNCQFCGSLNSMPAHYKTFHPNERLLSQSVIDPNRCGVCNGIFKAQPSSNNAVVSCDCPQHKRVLADCLDLRNLTTIQNFGKEYYAYKCVLCTKFHHYENECLQHILNCHRRRDIIPQRCVMKQILYACDLCGHTATYVKDIIQHIRSLHFSNAVQGTVSDRMAQYNKIGVIYPKGLKLYISDLRLTGAFDKESFKRDVQCVES